jgi:glycosyltransferase involved in cell wall biosynthesis
MDMPLISVIVPVYNAEKFLHRCIDSILAQTFKDFELILINDGSKDNSGTICDEYAINYSCVRVFHKENGGVSTARNLGLDNAKGRWIAFIDSDDYVDADFLKLYINNIDGTSEIVIQSIKVIDHDYVYATKPQCLIEGSAIDIMVALKYDDGTIGYIFNKLFSFSIISKNRLRFKEDIRLREDEDFVLRYLLYIKKGRIIDKGGYNYIMPDYWNKYSDIDVFDIEVVLYKTAKAISGGKNNSALDNYQIELTLQLMATVFAGNYSHIKIFVKTIGLKVFRWISIKAIIKKIFDFLRKKYNNLISL